MKNEVESKQGIKLRVAQATRTIAQQNALYAQGRTVSGRIVTNVKGGESYHNYGLAIDVVEIKNGKTNWNTNWAWIKQVGISHGFTWGGDWTTPDRPHFQMDFGLSIQQLKSGQRPKDKVYIMKLTKKIFTLVFLTFTCAFTYACENQSCNMNKLDEVQKVEHTYIPFKTEDFLEETTEGGSYTYYKNKENVIRKIEMIFYGEIGKTEVTYYLLSEKNYKIQYKELTYTNFIYAEDSEVDSVTSGTIYICDNKEIVSAPDTEDKVKNFKRQLKTVLDEIDGKLN